MKVLLIRHAIAEERDVFGRTGQPDSERPLTDEGRRKMRKGTNRLRTLVRKVECVGSSGLVRADETAEIVAKAFKCPVTEVPGLVPEGDRDQVLEWLRGFPDEALVGMVGHEPDLGRLLGYMLCGRPLRALGFKKGGVCLAQFHGRPAPGGAMLQWALTPSQLRDLKD